MITKPSAPSSKQEWPLLKGLWRGGVVGGKVLVGAFLGGWVVGLTAWLMTIYCYGIGALLGLPLGLVVGVILAVRASASDVFLSFGLSVSTWIVLARVLPVPPQASIDSLIHDVTPPSIGALVAVLAFFGLRGVPHGWKRAIGGGLSLALLGWGVVAFLGRIYG